MRLLIATLAALLWLVLPAYGHGPAEWIQRGGYKNAAGELCCGERDCGEKVSGEIVATPQGYKVDAVFRIGGEGGSLIEVHELVPYDKAQPSPDGIFWRCQWGGERKCFFAPPPGS